MLTVENIKQALSQANLSINCAVEDSLNIQFKDLGLDSLDLFNLFLELEEISGKNVSDEDIDELVTFNLLLDYYND